MSTDPDLDLYRRGMATAVACWTAYARAIPGGSVHRLPGVDLAVFTDGPERDVLNNAVLAPGLGHRAQRHAVDAMVAAYADAGVTSYAAWVHETDTTMLGALTERGFAHQETTWAMGRSLDAVVSPAGPQVVPARWAEYLQVLELPTGLLARADPADFSVVVGRWHGEAAATGMVYDHDGDAGVYNVGTLSHARKRGLGSAVVSRLLHDAAVRGCTTATLQSTEMARGVYAGQGFRDLGRILELGPRAA